MNPQQREALFARYTVVVRDVMATLGTKDGIAWVRQHRQMAHRSVAQLEQTWALDKHRRMQR